MVTRRRFLAHFLPAVLLLPALAGAAPPPHVTLVVCAPGYPGTTEQAQPSMDGFSRASERAAGWSEGALVSIYFETAEAGIARLRESDAALALVPLPFLLQYGGDHALRPRLRVVEESGSDEIWSLVAKRGQVSSSASLAGWEVTGMPGYSPGFVRGPVLGRWGALPAEARISFTSRPLSALRRAAAGEKIAVVLNHEQSAALPSLPFAAELEIVARSAPLPGTILCTVGDRLKGVATDALVKALLHLHERPEGAEALRSLRMTRFEEGDAAALEALRAAFDGLSGAAR